MRKTESKNLINNVIFENEKRLNVFKLKEPFEEEMSRIRFDEFTNEAKEFAYKLEGVDIKNRYTKDLKIDKYTHLTQEKNSFYTRYLIGNNSKSLGLILTNIDLSRLDIKKGHPILWQMGFERARLALAQRALFFDQNQNRVIFKIIRDMEAGKIKFIPRTNKRSMVVDEIIRNGNSKKQALYTPAVTELGYKKISSDRLISRREIHDKGLFNIVGKFPRKIIGLGAMPPVSGWRDTLVTSAIGHMICFIPRSSIFAFELSSRVKLGQEVKSVINTLKIPASWKEKSLRNIGAALGADNPEEELQIATVLYKEAGIKLFRIYTIGSDIRVIKIAKLLRQKFGKDIEIFVGQIADKKQAVNLISKDIAVDGLIYGHGGGQQCTSAINGMAITTLEDIYEVSLDKNFNNTSILVEGGIGKSIGTALILGVDACLGNQKFVRGCIETGNLFASDKNGKICQPYPGTASPVTQIIESQSPLLSKRRIDAAGRTHTSEGKPGLMYYEAKAGSMAFWITEYLRHAARTLADLGVRNIYELRSFLKKDNREYLRIMSEKTQYLSEPHWNLGM